MRYFKNIFGDYITSISTESGEIEISKPEYDQILNVIRSRPTPPEGYDYKLRTDLTWELVELPPEPDEPTVEDKAEAYDILMGVEQ